jgi:hypothetical protein
MTVSQCRFGVHSADVTNGQCCFEAETFEHCHNESLKT